MALGTTNISVSLVQSTLNARDVNLKPIHDIGALCTHQNVNQWSKWKPVNLSKVSGITTEDLSNINYGLVIVTGVTPQALKLACEEDGYSVGYVQPSTAFRLGDFRNYDHNAVIPTSSGIGTSGLTVKKGASVYNDVPTIMSYATIEVSGNSTTNVTVQNLYGDGTVYRGIMLINSVGDSVWKTGQVDWNVSPIKTWLGNVTAFVFYTNIEQTTFRAGNSAELDAVFYAVPVSSTKVNPFAINATNDYAENSIKYAVTASAILAGTEVDFSLTFYADRYETAGGSLTNVQAVLFNPANSQVIETRTFGDWTLAKGTTKNYLHVFTNAQATYNVKIYENGVLIKTQNIIS